MVGAGLGWKAVKDVYVVKDGEFGAWWGSGRCRNRRCEGVKVWEYIG